MLTQAIAISLAYEQMRAMNQRRTQRDIEETLLVRPPFPQPLGDFFLLQNSVNSVASFGADLDPSIGAAALPAAESALVDHLYRAACQSNRHVVARNSRNLPSPKMSVGW